MSGMASYASAIADAAREPLLLLDAELRVVAVSRAFCAAFGVASDDTVGRCVFDIDDGGWDVPALRRLLPEVLRERAAADDAPVVVRHGALRRELAVNVRRLDDGAPGAPVLLIAVEDVAVRRGAVPAAPEEVARLRQRESRWRTLLENAADPIVIIGAERRVRYGSPALQHMLGYAPEELAAVDGLTLVHPEDACAVGEALTRVMAAPGSVEELELRFRHRAGHWLVLAVTMRNLLHDPAVKGVVCSSRDVTTRRRLEEELRLSERRLRATFEALPLPTAAWQRQGDDFVMLEFNEAAARASQGRMQQRLGNTLTEYYGDVPSVIASFHEAARTPGRPVRQEMDYRYRSTGELRRMVFTCVAATPDLVIVYGEDLTPQRQAEALFRGISEQAVTGIYVYQDDRFVYANPRLAELLGYTIDEFLALDASRVFVHPGVQEEMAARIRRRLAGGDGAAFYTHPALHKDGRAIDLEIHATSVTYQGRDALLGTVLDVSERRRLEEQLRQAQKMEAVGRLAGGIAHDFNNLLTVMKMNVDFLLEEIDAADPRHDEVAEIGRSANRATALVRQLLAFSRRQVLNPRELDLDVTVSDLGRMLGRLIGEDVELVLQLQEDLGHVMADPGQIEQVIVNLSVNARDAMPKGGRLTIGTANVRVDRGYRQMPPGDYVLLTVSDTGQGMDGATLERIFEPFFTTKGPGQGTGLGLATVYGIIKQSEGYIWVDSEPGRGTSFRIYLPRLAGTGSPEYDRPATAQAGGSETLLLVEDEEGVRLAARRILERLGYTVLEASNGREALSVARDYAGRIDVLVTDAVMPGLGGRDLAEALRRDGRAAAVLYMSGYTDDEIIRRGMLEPGSIFVEKPFTAQALAQAVRQVLAEQPGQGSGD